jgi:hypothetical protein
MGDESNDSSVFKSATFVAAVIGCVSAVLSAVLPWWLGSQGREDLVTPAPVPGVQASVLPVTPLTAAPARTLPNLTLGVWTIVESIDEVGTDYRGSTIKFKTQRETPHGLELTGSFEWRTDNMVLLGQEHFVAHYDATTRQVFIEGQYVESPTGTLAVGSFSATLSEDGRQLVDGTWGNTPNHQAGVPGSWKARR